MSRRHDGCCRRTPPRADFLPFTTEAREPCEVCDREDCRSLRSIRFMVDPTGRYTPVPRVDPLVESTAFC